MPIKEVHTGGPIWVHLPIKSWAAEIEETALMQLRNVASLPFVYKHVACMPDVHAGIGATIGSVIATKGAIIPAAVGVDIGCGMTAVCTGYTRSQLPEDLKGLHIALEADIPHGRTDNGGAADVGAWHPDMIPKDIVEAGAPLDCEAKDLYFGSNFPWHEHLNQAARQLGTLGGGNHFLEVCTDAQDNVWIVDHSGSRGVGNAIGKFYIKEAKRLMEQYFIRLPDKELAFLPEGTPEFSEYRRWMNWALSYAELNRSLMIQRACKVVDAFASEAPVSETSTINCHHNYAAKENHFGENVWVTRKGAIRAREGDYGIIPGAMGRHTYIVRGLGNTDSFCSASHGAGRVKSRRQAEREHTLEELTESMAGVECNVCEGMIDEIQDAYKDLDEVMDCQNDLVEVVCKLNPVVCIKGAK